MPELTVTGQIDIERKGHVLTLVGVGGTVVVTTVDTSGAKLYVYHPQVGWKLRVDSGRDDPKDAGLSL